MIFHLHREAAVPGVEARPFCDGPALEDAAPAKAEVVVQVTRRVLLDDKGQAANSLGFWERTASRSLARALLGRAAGFCGDPEVPHVSIAG